MIEPPHLNETSPNEFLYPTKAIQGHLKFLDHKKWGQIVSHSTPYPPGKHKKNKFTLGNPRR